MVQPYVLLRPTSTNVENYKRESAALRNAVAGALEPSVRRYLNGTPTPREAWLALEQQFQSSDDAYLVSIEQEPAGRKLLKDGEGVEHVANFCCLRRLAGTRFKFVLADQASIDMVSISLATY